MTNNAVFNNEKNPLSMLINNAYTSPAIIAPPEENAAVNGRLFIVTSGSSSIGAANNQLIQITNPSGSGRSLYISSISGGISAAATLNLYSTGTVTGGTTPTPFNSQFGNTTASIATARVATGTITGTPTLFMTMLLAAGVFNFTFTGAIIVPPNRAITISVGTGVITAATNIVWWEA
ncbi:hypothetical protein [Paenibacillus sp. KS-LC4]|uniref:hypothetical protein n=1 Tax=Paenibacillus sp. KS-LC4 TaxID=2979727 RepID=UPI0030D57CEE